MKEQEKIGFSRKSNKELWNEMKGFDKNSVKKEFRTFIDDFRKTGQALKADPFDAKLHINFSDSMLNIKQYGAAIMHYEQAVKLSPKLSDWVELRICRMNLLILESRGLKISRIIANRSPTFLFTVGVRIEKV